MFRDPLHNLPDPLATPLRRAYRLKKREDEVLPDRMAMLLDALNAQDHARAKSKREVAEKDAQTAPSAQMEQGSESDAHDQARDQSGHSAAEDDRTRGAG